jgi:DNA-binding XRE family transcriptional regulator
MVAAVKLKGPERALVMGEVARLRARRIAKRLTQIELAPAIGITPNTLRSWEVGLVFPRLDQWVAWRRALGLTTGNGDLERFLAGLPF